MDLVKVSFLPFFVWLGFAGLIGCFVLMYRWARRQKGAALAIGMLVQMFLPDPQVQQTIECVTKSKQEEKRKAPASKDRKKNL